MNGSPLPIPSPWGRFPQVLPALALGAVLGGIAACGAGSAPPTAPLQGVTPAAAESPAPEATAQDDCLTWADYQGQAATQGDEVAPWLQMPPGFETGCVFRAGMGMGNPLYILPNGQPLTTVGDPSQGAIVPEEPIPWFGGDEVDLEALAAREAEGTLLAYFFACTTQGAFEQNCAGFSQERPYLIESGASCFQGFCLQAAGLTPEARLALWSGFPGEATEGGLSAEQRTARQNFQTVAIGQFFPEEPVMGLDPEAIALEALGRTTLQEGEEPTQVETLGTYPNYLVVLVTNFGQADDAVGGERYRLEFTYGDNDRVILTWMGQQRYCRRGTPPGWSAQWCP